MGRQIFDRGEPSRVRIKEGIGVRSEIHFERKKNIALSHSRGRNTEKKTFVSDILLCVRYHAY